MLKGTRIRSQGHEPLYNCLDILGCNSKLGPQGARGESFRTDLSALSASEFPAGCQWLSISTHDGTIEANPMLTTSITLARVLSPKGFCTLFHMALVLALVYYMHYIMMHKGPGFRSRSWNATASFSSPNESRLTWAQSFKASNHASSSFRDRPGTRTHRPQCPDVTVQTGRVGKENRREVPKRQHVFPRLCFYHGEWIYR